MITNDLQIFIKKNIIDKNINAKYLETGFLKGESAFEMLSLGFKKVVSIEIDENFVNEGEKKFSTFIKDQRLEIVKGDSAEKISKYFSDDFHVVFLDAHGTIERELKDKSAPLERELEIILEKGLKDHQLLIIDDYIKIKHFYLFAYNIYDWRYLAGKTKNLIKKFNKKIYEVPYKNSSYLLIVGKDYKFHKNLFKNLFFKIYNFRLFSEHLFYLFKRIAKFYLKKILK
jgi:hypothetical protein